MSYFVAKATKTETGVENIVIVDTDIVGVTVTPNFKRIRFSHPSFSDLTTIASPSFCEYIDNEATIVVSYGDGIVDFEVYGTDSVQKENFHIAIKIEVY